MHIGSSLAAALLALPIGTSDEPEPRPASPPQAARPAGSAGSPKAAPPTPAPAAPSAPAPAGGAPASPAPAFPPSILGGPDQRPSPGRAALASLGETQPQRVEFETEDKLKLVGSFYTPKASKQAVPAALAVHDAGGKRGDLAELAERLLKQGFAVLVVDLRGHGESATADNEWGKLSGAERERLWNLAAKDLRAAVGWLQTQPGVHAASLSLVGYKAGSTIAARYALKDENVRSLALLSPPAEDAVLASNLSRDIETVAAAGLPTYLAVSKEEQQSATRMVGGGQHGAGEEFIELQVFKCARTDILVNRQVSADLAKWMMAKASPQKGQH